MYLECGRDRKAGEVVEEVVSRRQSSHIYILASATCSLICGLSDPSSMAVFARQKKKARNIYVGISTDLASLDGTIVVIPLPKIKKPKPPKTCIKVPLISWSVYNNSKGIKPKKIRDLKRGGTRV